MARRTQTYAIRLAVEGGGQVKAELVSVGQSGEQHLEEEAAEQAGADAPILTPERSSSHRRHRQRDNLQARAPPAKAGSFSDPKPTGHPPA